MLIVWVPRVSFVFSSYDKLHNLYRDMNNILISALIFLSCCSISLEASPVKGVSNHIWQGAIDISGLTESVMLGIIFQESGQYNKGKIVPNMFALNIEGSSFYPTSKDEAVLKIKEALESKKNVDVGYGQISLIWNGNFVKNAEDLLKPNTNIMTMAQVLKNCSKRFEFTNEILSCYHSGHRTKRGLAYADIVFDKISKYVKPYILNNLDVTRPSKVASKSSMIFSKLFNELESDNDKNQIHIAN
jgi:hypothetical protein